MPQFALVLTTFIWAATFPATKVALQEISPMAFLLLRFLVSTIAVGAVMVVMKQPLRLNARTLGLAAVGLRVTAGFHGHDNGDQVRVKIVAPGHRFDLAMPAPNRRRYPSGRDGRRPCPRTEGART